MLLKKIEKIIFIRFRRLTNRSQPSTNADFIGGKIYRTDRSSDRHENIASFGNASNLSSPGRRGTDEFFCKIFLSLICQDIYSSQCQVYAGLAVGLAQAIYREEYLLIFLIN